MSSSRRKFTLVELLVAVSLGVIILGIIAGVSLAAAGSRELSLARIERARQVEAVLDLIARDWGRSLLLPGLPSAHGGGPRDPPKARLWRAIRSSI